MGPGEPGAGRRCARAPGTSRPLIPVGRPEEASPLRGFQPLEQAVPLLRGVVGAVRGTGLTGLCARCEPSSAPHAPQVLSPALMALLSPGLNVRRLPSPPTRPKGALFLAPSPPLPLFPGRRASLVQRLAVSSRSQGRRSRLRLLAGPYRGHPRLPGTSSSGRHPRRRRPAGRSRLPRAVKTPPPLAAAGPGVPSRRHPLKWLL